MAAYTSIDFDAPDLCVLISALKSYSDGFTRLPNMRKRAIELQNNCEKKLAVLNELSSRG